MTDSMAAIFQKMVEGKIVKSRLARNSRDFIMPNEHKPGYWVVITTDDKEWGEYEQVWMLYESSPLMKALR